MWRPRSLISTLLGSLVVLLREQNSLLRELIEAQTHRPARTPRSTASEADLPRPAPVTMARRFTKDDVWYPGESRPVTPSTAPTEPEIEGDPATTTTPTTTAMRSSSPRQP